MFSGSARSNSQKRLITSTSHRTSALFRRIISKFCTTIWSGRKFYGGITRCWSKEKREYRYWGVSSITRDKRIPNDFKTTQIQALLCLRDSSWRSLSHWCQTIISLFSTLRKTIELKSHDYGLGHGQIRSWFNPYIESFIYFGFHDGQGRFLYSDGKE